MGTLGAIMDKNTYKIITLAGYEQEDVGDVELSRKEALKYIRKVLKISENKFTSFVKSGNTFEVKYKRILACEKWLKGYLRESEKVYLKIRKL